MAEKRAMADEPGVYGVNTGGRWERIHAYQGGDYGLEDIVEYFQLGRQEPAEHADEIVVVLTAAEMRQLKVMADSYSFDYEEEFIEMCLELHRFATANPGEQFPFRANF